MVPHAAHLGPRGRREDLPIGGRIRSRWSARARKSSGWVSVQTFESFRDSVLSMLYASTVVDRTAL